jgi:hypothetical protein
MPDKPPFFIKKWYFDGVSDDGRTLILYAASLHWHRLRIGYTSVLDVAPDGRQDAKSLFHDAPEPEITGDTLRWGDAKLGIRGTWVRAASAVSAVLHDGPEGRFDWTAHQPASRCRIERDGFPALTGWGYVECLETTVPPWEMAFSTLRWGRFAHPEHPVVWIDLLGTAHRTWLFDGDRVLHAAAVADDRVVWDNGSKTLLLEEPCVLEDKQKIFETVSSLVRWMPGFDRFTPLHFLQARATKWRSNGLLRVGATEQTHGWVVHECFSL